MLLQQHTRALLHFRGRSWGRHACSEPAAGEKMSVRARQRQVELPAAARLGGAGLKHACLAERSCLLFLLRGHGKRRGFASSSGLTKEKGKVKDGCGHYVVKKWHERLREKSDLDRRDIRRQPAHRLINA